MTPYLEVKWKLHIKDADGTYHSTKRCNYKFKANEEKFIGDLATKLRKLGLLTNDNAIMNAVAKDKRGKETVVSDYSIPIKGFKQGYTLHFYATGPMSAKFKELEEPE